MLQKLHLVPEVPASTPISFDHDILINKLLQQAPPVTSEMTFSNLLTWSGTHPLLLSRVGNTLLLWRGPADQGLLLTPLGETLDREGVRRALAWAESLGGPSRFARVPEQTAAALRQAEPSLAMVADRDHADYVYLQTDLANLAGRKFGSKRNLIKKFSRSVAASFREIDDELVAACLEMQREWCEHKSCSEHPDLDAEDQAVFRALEQWDHLPVFGGALVTDDEARRVIAFSVAEALGPDTAVIHFEKGTTMYPGVYQAINQLLCKRLLGEFEFVNREQDLGVPGLRKAKESYQPVRLVEKYTLEMA
ncbi:MAG: phosphatidylglycerol lysyltransferase domain-containing protein [Candidatus Lernaella stagnicola]|nr:phosphatidylglycerol lysyltransferase domain-containing protein [Candidatus Lernaella stagnicola]